MTGPRSAAGNWPRSRPLPPSFSLQFCCILNPECSSLFLCLLQSAFDSGKTSRSKRAHIGKRGVARASQVHCLNFLSLLDADNSNGNYDEKSRCDRTSPKMKFRVEEDNCVRLMTLPLTQEAKCRQNNEEANRDASLSD